MHTRKDIGYVTEIKLGLKMEVVFWLAQRFWFAQISHAMRPLGMVGSA